MSALSRVLKSFVADENGATAIEYGLICALIFLVIITAVTAFADGTVAMYDLIATAMTT
jgi:pilus assembly protein Flp/PilA